jgi:oligo-1,6-glucosidase
MTNTYFTEIEQYRDVEAINYHRDALSRGMLAEEVLSSLSAKGRDNARTPMQWDDSEHAGFTTGEPWLPANPNKDVVNAAAAVADPDSVFHHYRRLIELRHHDPVVVDGRFELLLPDHEQVWAFTRTLDEQVLLVVANCSSAPVDLKPDDLPEHSGAQLVLGSHGGPDDRDDPNDLDGLNGLTLAPWESRVYRL